MKFRFKPRLMSRLIYIVYKTYLPKDHCGYHHHTPNGNELIYVDYGELQICVEEEKHILHRGECFIVEGKVNHQLGNSGEKPMNYMDIMFYGDIPDELTHKILKVDREGHRIMNLLRDECRDELLCYKTICACELTHFLALMLRKATGSAAISPRPAYLENQTDANCVKILDIISRNYRTIRFSELARQTGMSDSALYLLFRDKIGHPFTKVVADCRLECARYLLQKGEMSLSEIASATGCKPSVFFRFFKKMTGMTPKEYATSLVR